MGALPRIRATPLRHGRSRSIASRGGRRRRRARVARPVSLGVALVVLASGAVAFPLAAGGQAPGALPVPGPDAGYRLPLDRQWLTVEVLGRAHHDHPAIDLVVPIGTPVYAARGGQVTYTRDPRCGRGILIAGTD